MPQAGSKECSPGGEMSPDSVDLSMLFRVEFERGIGIFPKHGAGDLDLPFGEFIFPMLPLVPLVETDFLGHEARRAVT